MADPARARESISYTWVWTHDSKTCIRTCTSEIRTVFISRYVSATSATNATNARISVFLCIALQCASSHRYRQMATWIEEGRRLDMNGHVLLMNIYTQRHPSNRKRAHDECDSVPFRPTHRNREIGILTFRKSLIALIFLSALSLLCLRLIMSVGIYVSTIALTFSSRALFPSPPSVPPSCPPSFIFVCSYSRHKH